jgi:hypothetical protein
MFKMRLICLAIVLTLMFTMFSACGGSGSGDGGTTFSFTEATSKATTAATSKEETTAGTTTTEQATEETTRGAEPTTEETNALEVVTTKDSDVTEPTSARGGNGSAGGSGMSGNVKANATLADLSDDLYSFQILADGVLYHFPMTYSEFTSQGWAVQRGVEALLPNQYGSLTFRKGDAVNGVGAYVDIINVDINERPYEECLIGGIDITNGDYTSDWGIDKGPVYLPGGIQYGVATMDDIKAAYGEPTDIYEGDIYTKMTYELDSYEQIALYVYKESGVLEEIDIQNFIIPEGYTYGSVSDEIPEDIKNYKPPTTIGDDFSSFAFKMDSYYYEVPFPVSELLDNGWTLVEADSADMISGGGYGQIVLRYGNNSTKMFVNNRAPNATHPKNCWVESVDLSAFSDSKGSLDIFANWELPGGLKPGSTEGDVVAALEGMNYEKNDTNSKMFTYYTCYLDPESKYRNRVEITCRNEDKLIYSVRIERRFGD